MTRDIEDEIRDEKNPRPLDEDDIALLKTYVSNPLSASYSVRAIEGLSDLALGESSLVKVASFRVSRIRVSCS